MTRPYLKEGIFNSLSFQRQEIGPESYQSGRSLGCHGAIHSVILHSCTAVVSTVFTDINMRRLPVELNILKITRRVYQSR